MDYKKKDYRLFFLETKNGKRVFWFIIFVLILLSILEKFDLINI